MNFEIGGLDYHVIVTEYMSIEYTCNIYLVMHSSM